MLLHNTQWQVGSGWQHDRNGNHLLLVAVLAALLALALILLWAMPIHAQSDPNWQATYWNNMELSGAPVLVRNESDLSHDWGSGSPAPGVNNDHFSARWTRWVDFGAGRYRFNARVDDGVRLWVSNSLLIDQWRDQPATEYSGEIYLTDGPTPIRMEFYENEGLAVVRLGWQRLGETYIDPGEVGEWRAEFYDNRDLSGSPDYVRYDYEVNYDWGSGAPAPGIDDDNFSVRWTRVAYFSGGRYRFAVTCDDGIRLYVDGKRIMNEWHDMAATRMTADISLNQGKHTVRLEYYEHRGAAVARLTWDTTEEREPQKVGNIITCAPPQPYSNAWVKVYRRTDAGDWENLTPKGIGAIDATGFLKIDGLPVDVDRYRDQGHPYCVEVYLDGALINSCGNTDHGETEFRVFPSVDNYTPWPCAQPSS